MRTDQESPAEAQLRVLVDDAYAHTVKEEWAAARDCLTRAVALGPEIAQLHGALGVAYFRLKDFRAATESFSRAIELQPQNAEFLIQAAVVHLEAQQFAEAELLSRRALGLNAADPTALNLLKRCLRARGVADDPSGAEDHAGRPATPERIDWPTARATLQEVKLDDGLSLEIGDFSYVHGRHIRNPSGARTHIRLGKFCSIATDLTVIGYDHRMEWISTYPFLDAWHRLVWDGTEHIPAPAAPELGGNRNRGDITIGSDVWIGHDVKLFKGVTIGHGAVIGACSLVNKDVPPYTIVAGVPARPIRRRFADDVCDFLLSIEWWNWSNEKINRFLPYLCSSRIADLKEELAREAGAVLGSDTSAVAAAGSFSSFRPPEAEGKKARDEIQHFIDRGHVFFQDVEPARLGSDHLAHSRILPNRKDILDHMPKGGICAEIGTQTGRFAKSILRVLQPAKFHIYDLDFTPFDFAHFEADLQRGVIELHRGDSSSLLSAAPDQSFDFIYVDGDHAYEGVARDLAQAARKIKDDGWIVCNDYTVYSPLEQMKYGVYRAVNELCLQDNFEIVYLGLHPWGYHDVALRKIRPHADETREPRG